MEIQKLRLIMKWIEGRGKMPADQFGSVLEPRDLIVLFGLNEVLDADEQLVIARELRQLIEAQEVIERLEAAMH